MYPTLNFPYMKTIKDLVYHTKAEKKSLMIIVLIVTVLTMVDFLVNRLSKPTQNDLCHLEELFQDTLINFAFQNKSNHSVPFKRRSPTTKSQKVLLTNVLNDSIQIDPNNASKDTLLQLGLSDYAVNNLLKYRASGGKFNHPENITKIYGIDSIDYYHIKGNLIIGDKNEGKRPTLNKVEFNPFQDSSQKSGIARNSGNIPRKKEKAILIDINSADEIQLQYIKGIGPAFAKRIVKYRDLIGGYHNKLQLLEVYGLDRNKYNEIEKQVKVGGSVTHLNINSNSYKELSKHPYVSWQEAKLLVAYTKKHGQFKSAYDIVKIGVMDSMWVEKLIPYLPDSMSHRKAQTPLISL